jgi:phage terminase large subunit-like protein
MPFNPNKPVQPSGEEHPAFNPTKAVVPFMTVEGPDTPNPFANSETPWGSDEELAPDVDDDSPLTIDNTVFPRVASQTIRGMSAAERAEWDADRFKARTDQLFLSGVMGLDLVPNPHAALFGLFLHKTPGAPLYSLDPVTKKRLVLWPRGSAKTHAVRVEEVQLILNYPNIRICFLTGGDDLAKRQLAALKRVFSQPTQRFKELFPEFCLVSKQDKRSRQWTDVSPVWGNAHEFSVPARTDDTLPEPTFAISTARSVNSGSHFDVIVIDDLVHDKNWQSAALLEKCYQDYLSITPLLDPNGYIIMTGTRYAIGDTYERIQDNAEEIGQLSVWKFSVRNCWSTGCRNCKHADVFHDHSINVVQPPCTACPCLGFQSDGVDGVLFPQVMKRNGEPFGHTLEYLQRQRAEQGEKFFANQYLNEPVAEGTKVFTEALIGSVTLHHENQLPIGAQAQIFLVGDLAYSTNADRDESVIYAFSKFHGALYFWGCWSGRWGAAEKCERVLQLLKQVRPVKAFFEENLNSDSFQLNLVAMAPKYGLPSVGMVEWIKTSNKKDAKNSRIADIELAMKGRRVFIYAAMPHYDRLNSQLLKFPNIKHDDYADAFALGLQAPTGWQYETTPPPPELLNRKWTEKYLGASAEPQADWPDNGAGTGICC